MSDGNSQMEATGRCILIGAIAECSVHTVRTDEVLQAATVGLKLKQWLTGNW